MKSFALCVQHEATVWTRSIFGCGTPRRVIVPMAFRAVTQIPRAGRAG